MINITIDESAGFCWGVVRTVEIAEECLQNKDDENVYILGSIIHNPREIERLEAKGLKTINHSDLDKLAHSKTKVLIRAHGEPPATYQRAKELGIDIIDATCPLVTALQRRVKKYYQEGMQIVIFGKKEHAEVIGLRGVCNDECIVVKNVDEALNFVDFSKKTVLISQTTMDKITLQEIKEALEARITELKIEDSEKFMFRDTICKYVSDREENLKQFAVDNDIIIFVAGRNSSNGKSLYHICKSRNDKTFFIEDIKELDNSWFNSDIKSIGITGATSTPQWYLKLVKEEIESRISK